MLKRIIVLIAFLFLCFGTRPFAQSNPTPVGLNPPDYNYSEPNGCTACHFTYGAKGDHMLEAVGVKFDDQTKVFSFTGNGWFASQHSRSNYGTTQNTFCAKCHSPLQAKAESTYENGIFRKTAQIPDGKVEGVVCATCHPSSASAKILGRRLGLYRFGMDKSTPEAYRVIKHGEEDKLCMNCHKQRHDNNNPAFRAMYEIGVRCMDCHLAPYGKTNNGQGNVQRRFHDFKVAKNLPFSCGLNGSESGFACHSEFSKESTLKLIPFLKKQHKKWGHLDRDPDEQSPTSISAHGLTTTTKKRKLDTKEDYYRLWQELEREVENEVEE
jgi:hypothetical protein